MGDAWASVDTSINFEAPQAPVSAPSGPTMNRRRNVSTAPAAASAQAPQMAGISPDVLLNNGFASMMANNARGAISGKIKQFTPGVTWVWDQFTERFDVNNAYVVRKLRLLLFPMQASWVRITEAEATGAADMNENSNLAPPVFDHNAPDMYIPFMSFATYPLVVALWQGINGKFDPDHIQQIIYTGSLTAFMEAAIFFAAFYRFGILEYASQFFDLLCLFMYKFFGLCLIVALETVSNGNRIVYLCVLSYTAACFALFLYQSLVANIPETGLAGAQKSVVLGVTVLEVLIMWWLSLV